MSYTADLVFHFRFSYCRMRLRLLPSILFRILLLCLTLFKPCCYVHVQDIAQEAVKKRRRATKKPYSRAIVGTTLEVIQKRRTEKPEVRDAAREAALRCVYLFLSSIGQHLFYALLMLHVWIDYSKL